MKRFIYSLIALSTLIGTSSCSDDDDPQPVQPVTVESVSIDSDELSLEIGETAKLNATVVPADAENKTVTWSSSDQSVATVSDDGTVTAIAPGTTDVTATAGGKTATCHVTVNRPFVAPNLGDYFYSDGSWSTEVDESKTIIGVVFWIGDPTANDATLRADHPECNHGLVLSLDQKDGIAWQPNCESAEYTISEWVEQHAPQFSLPRSGNADDDPLQNIIGYNNTKAIEAFNAATENSEWIVEPIKWVVEYRSEVPAPLTTSDWYLPSPKELSLLCAGELEGNIYIKRSIMTNINIINPRLTAIGQRDLVENAFWSSTENYIEGNDVANQTAWNYYFKEVNRPLSYSFKTWGEEYAFVRAVLAF